MTEKLFAERFFEAGFTDLIPVIPPGAQLTPSSKITQNMLGKIPGRRGANGLWGGFDWRTFEATIGDVRKWSVDGASTGLRANYFPALDIDVSDDDLAQVIEDVARAKLGDACVRVGRAPKRLMMYFTEKPFGRMRMHITASGKKHLVEILGSGQQYLVHGTHPATMKPYQWLQDPTAEGAPLVTIGLEKVEAFMAELEAVMTMFGHTISRVGDGGVRVAPPAADQQALLAPSLELLQQAVALIPNDDTVAPGRDEYIRMGYAIRAAAGEQNVEEGFEVFASWCDKHETDGRVEGNPETWLADWRRMSPPYSVGWGFIAEIARGYGFNDAAEDFEVVADSPTEPEPESAPYSEQWLASKLVDKLIGRLRYVPQKGSWLVWDGARWKIDADLAAEDMIKKGLLPYADKLLRMGSIPAEKKANTSLSMSICSRRKISEVAAVMRSDRAMAVPIELLDQETMYLNTPAGIVSLVTGTLSSPDPDSLMTRMTAIAPDFSGTHPEWDRFLNEATGGDRELVGYLQRLAGYALTGETREQHVSFIYGGGGNGKSVFLNVLSGILGDYAKVASMDTFTVSANEKHSTDIAGLMGARLVVASETTQGKRWDEARVKQLSGGEPVTARFMRQDNFTFTPQFKLVFAGNHRPEMRGVGVAMRRRLQMVPFTVSPKVVDNQLGAKLKAEWPAILAWMIEGCQRWQQQKLNPPAVVAAATNDYFAAEDAIGRWMLDCIAEDEDATVETLELFRSWQEWANANNEFVGSSKRFSTALQERGAVKWKDPKTRRNGFVGLRLDHRQDLSIVA